MVKGLFKTLLIIGIPVVTDDIKLPKATGPLPTGIVAVTVFDEVLITLTVLEPLLATSTLLPSGLIEIPVGDEPTEIVANTLLLIALITLTDESP